MKKIFTLIGVALMAMGANAQEVWSAADLDLTTAVKKEANTVMKKVATIYETNPLEDTNDQEAAKAVIDAGAPAEGFFNFTFTVSTPNVTLKGVSTPNAGVPDADAFKKKAGAESNEALNTDACSPKFIHYVKPDNGNPAMESCEYYFLNSEKTEVGPRYAEIFWTKDCGQLPAKGCYYEITTATAGTLKLGVFINKNNQETYIYDTQAKAVIANDKIGVEFYYQNNGFKFTDNDVEVSLVKGTMPADNVIAHTNGYTQNRPTLGYLTFPVEANKSYIILNPKSQVGIYGYEFTAAGGESGIATIAAEQKNAPIFNLAGQRVGKNVKGLMIQNGKKFLVK